MNLVEQIDCDLKEAMKARNALKLGTLRMVKSALKYAAIEKGGVTTILSHEDATAVLRKQIKQREDSVESFERGGRTELAEKEKMELVILRAYLPQGLSEAEIDSLVREVIREVGATCKAQMGVVMKAAQVKAAGRADGKQLIAMVQKLLAS